MGASLGPRALDFIKLHLGFIDNHFKFCLIPPSLNFLGGNIVSCRDQ